MESFVLTYFDWFGSSSFLPDGFGVSYTMDDLVFSHWFSQPEAGTGYDTITFTDADYAQYGWIGYTD